MQEDPGYERYHRQMILRDFGGSAQRKLQQARVLVVGAGGLGCPALLYLAGAGVGRIGIVDGDTVSLDNLHRQVLYGMDDLGAPKAEVAARRLGGMNPDIEIFAYPFRLINMSCTELFPEYDLVLDCTDTFAARYMINDACVLMGRPLVSAAVSRYQGQIAVFNADSPDREASVNYRDIFPTPPKPSEIPNCSEAGIIGMLPGILGTMQAAEAFKLITGIGRPLSGRMITYDMLENRFMELTIDSRHPNASGIPADIGRFLETDYAHLCSSMTMVEEIDAEDFDTMRTGPDIIVVDVREMGELPIIDEFDHLHIPLSALDENIDRLHAEKVVFLCQSGQRSLQAAGSLTRMMTHPSKAFSLRGGIIKWKQYRKSIGHV